MTGDYTMAAIHIYPRRSCRQGPETARMHSLALRLVAVIAATAAMFLLSAWAGELLWALIGAGLVVTLGEGRIK